MVSLAGIFKKYKQYTKNYSAMYRLSPGKNIKVQ